MPNSHRRRRRQWAPVVPPFPMDGQAQEFFDNILPYIHNVLPGPPTSRNSTGLSALLLPHDDLDRLSALPGDLLRNVVSRLPVKDAARTTALSHRWRRVWHSAPLVLVDSHLLPVGTSDLDPAQVARRVTSAVSRIFAAHPGRFRCVHLISSYREESQGLVARWLHLLAVNGVQVLVLANRPLSLDTRLPVGLFGMATLTRLYLGLWTFPDTASIPHAISFPNLHELGLCSVRMKCRDMDFILARSPVLEILCIQGNLMDRLTLVGRRLRCVRMIMVHDLEIAVEDAPLLESLIVWSTCNGACKRIKIGRAPALSILGHLEPKLHTLQVGNTVIKPGIRAHPRTMVPSVKILGLKVSFGILNEAEMLPCILRCFPNVERLRIESKKTSKTTCKLIVKFWKETGATECIHSHIKLMVFQNFRGDENELCFLNFFLDKAQMLTDLVIVCAKGCFASKTDADSRVKSLLDTKWATNGGTLLLVESAFAENEQPLAFQRGSDFSMRDPFGLIV